MTMKKPITFPFFCLILLLTIPCFSGCGPKRPTLGQVEGTVHFDGEPIKEGTIVFAVSGTRDASGIIENGVIKNITTFDTGDGTPLGEARIAVLVFQDLPSRPLVSSTENTGGPGQPTMLGGGKRLAIPEKYANPETSGLTATIKKGINKIDLELTK